MLLGFETSSQWMIQLNVGAVGAIILLFVLRPGSEVPGPEVTSVARTG